MPKLLQISQLGHKVLREKAAFVDDINDDGIQNLIDDLINTITDVKGLGICAPQVHESKRIFIMASNPSLRYPHAPKMEPTAIINPKIISYSEEVIKDWEGCLSVPGIRALTPRHKSVDVEYTDRHGIRHENRFEDFLARIFQHEFDHLDGLLFLDRLESNMDIIVESEYQKIISNR